MPAKFALIIGNTEYTDPKLAQLAAPSEDAESLARLLKARDLASFDDVVTLINRMSYDARRAIAQFFANKRPDDLLVLYFSGHGVRDEQGRLFLATRDTDNLILDATAIPADFVTRAMDNCRSKRQVLILDCCNSGAFAYGTKAAAGASMGTAGAFEGNGYGRVVLTATDATQFAYEGDRVVGQGTPNSLFTHFLIKGLEGEADTDGDGRISVDELYDYTSDQIHNLTPNQKPEKFVYHQQERIILTTRVKPETVLPAPLDPELQAALESTANYVRKAAVEQLRGILCGPNHRQALTAERILKQLAETDDSLTIRSLARQILDEYQSGKPAAATDVDRKSYVPEQQRPIPARATFAMPEPTEDERKAVPAPAPLREQPVRQEAEPPRAQPSGTGARPPRKRWWIIGIGGGLILITAIIAVALCSNGQCGGSPSGPAVDTPWVANAPWSVSPEATQPSGPTAEPAQPIDQATEPAPAPITEPPPAPTPPGGGLGLISFVSTRDGNWEGYLINSDGANQRNLTNNPAIDGGVTIAPDGNKIAFTSSRGDNSDIYVANLDGSNPVRLTKDPAIDNGPFWSPDGSHIAFSSERDGNWEVYVMAADGSAQSRWTNNPAEDFVTDWSPDGAWLALFSTRDGNWEIYLMSVVSSEMIRLTDNPAGDGIASFSPQGDRLVFHSNRDGKWQIYMMNMDGTGLTRLSDGTANDDHPSWSPDGRRIAFVSDRNGSSALYTMNIDGSDITRLAGDVGFESGTGW